MTKKPPLVMVMRMASQPGAPDYYLRGFNGNISFTISQDEAYLFNAAADQAQAVVAIKKLLGPNYEEMQLTMRSYTGNPVRLHSLEEVVH